MPLPKSWEYILPVGIPCIKAKIYYKYTTETPLSALVERALQIIKILKSVRPEALQDYFGFSVNEIRALISILQEEKYIIIKDDLLYLSPAGLKLFGRSIFPSITTVKNADPLNILFLNTNENTLVRPSCFNIPNTQVIHFLLPSKNWSAKNLLTKAFLNNLSNPILGTLSENANLNNFHSLTTISTKKESLLPLPLIFSVYENGDLIKTFPTSEELSSLFTTKDKEQVILDLTKNIEWQPMLNHPSSKSNVDFDNFMVLEPHFWNIVQNLGVTFTNIVLALNDSRTAKFVSEDSSFTLGDDNSDFATKDLLQYSSIGTFLEENLHTGDLIYWLPAKINSSIHALKFNLRRKVLEQAFKVGVEPITIHSKKENNCIDNIEKLLNNPQIEIFYIRKKAIALVYHYVIGELQSSTTLDKYSLSVPIQFLTTNMTYFNIGEALLNI